VIFEVDDGMSRRIAITFSREPENHKKNIKLDRQRYGKYNSYETRQIWRHRTPTESEALTIYPCGFGRFCLHSTLQKHSTVDYRNQPDFSLFLKFF
jgi:hypothetical protein